MPSAEPILYSLEWNWNMVDTALEGLDEAALARQPSDQCNSAAWILWHMNRVLDTLIHTRLRSMPQLWVSEGWHRKYGMDDDPEERGVGWTAEQVSSWQPPSRDVQLGYYEAVKAAAKEFISSLGAEQLEAKIVLPPVSEPRPVWAALGQVTWDNISHGGQIAYLRGLFIGMGWHR